MTRPRRGAAETAPDGRRTASRVPTSLSVNRHGSLAARVPLLALLHGHSLQVRHSRAVTALFCPESGPRARGRHVPVPLMCPAAPAHARSGTFAAPGPSGRSCLSRLRPFPGGQGPPGRFAGRLPRRGGLGRLNRACVVDKGPRTRRRTRRTPPVYSRVVRPTSFTKSRPPKASMHARHSRRLRPVRARPQRYCGFTGTR